MDDGLKLCCFSSVNVTESSCSGFESRAATSGNQVRKTTRTPAVPVGPADPCCGWPQIAILRAGEPWVRSFKDLESVAAIFVELGL